MVTRYHSDLLGCHITWSMSAVFGNWEVPKHRQPPWLLLGIAKLCCHVIDLSMIACEPSQLQVPLFKNTFLF